jgi:hypothetical protein
MLDMGLQGQGAFGAGYPPAATPAAAGASAQGPTTISQKAFGIVTGGSGMYPAAHFGLISVGGACIAALLYIYWSLPRLGGYSVRVTLPGVVVGVLLYWGFQHFTGKGNTGKSKAS